jgi:hypothetical protein
LIISNLEKQEDNSYKLNFKATDKEMEYLLNFAINNLIMLGIIAVNEDNNPDDKQEVDFMAKVTPTFN